MGKLTSRKSSSDSTTVTIQQKDRIMSFMRQNWKYAVDQMSDMDEKTELDVKLAKELNALEGPKKSIVQWYQTWENMWRHGTLTSHPADEEFLVKVREAKHQKKPPRAARKSAASDALSFTKQKLSRSQATHAKPIALPKRRESAVHDRRNQVEEPGHNDVVYFEEKSSIPLKQMGQESLLFDWERNPNPAKERVVRNLFGAAAHSSMDNASFTDTNSGNGVATVTSGALAVNNSNMNASFPFVASNTANATATSGAFVHNNYNVNSSFPFQTSTSKPKNVNLNNASNPSYMERNISDEGPFNLPNPESPVKLTVRNDLFSQAVPRQYSIENFKKTYVDNLQTPHLSMPSQALRISNFASTPVSSNVTNSVKDERTHRQFKNEILKDVNALIEKKLEIFSADLMRTINDLMKGNTTNYVPPERMKDQNLQAMKFEKPFGRHDNCVKKEISPNENVDMGYTTFNEKDGTVVLIDDDDFDTFLKYYPSVDFTSTENVNCNAQQSTEDIDMELEEAIKLSLQDLDK